MTAVCVCVWSVSVYDSSVCVCVELQHMTSRPHAWRDLAQALILIPNLKYFESRNFDQKP
jgi:hypothetical protein